MSYKIEEVNGCTKKIIFNFENPDFSAEVQEQLKKKRREANLKGFRKGKAPMAMVEQMYKAQVESEALNSFVQKELFQAVQKEELRVVGQPSLENFNFDPGKLISFEAHVELYPEVELKDMSKLSFSKDKVEVTADDIEEAKKQFLASKAEMKPITDGRKKLKEGIFATMNFQGETADGEKPEGMKGEEFVLEIGSGQFIPGFEDGMIGMKKGETKEIDLTFPADYHATELQNAKVKFTVELLEMKEKVFPEFTDELAKEVGFESVADFEEKNKERLQEQKERQAQEKLNQEIIEKLVSENTFDVPKALVAQQEEYLKGDMTRTLKQQGFTDEMVQEYFTRWTTDLSDKAIFQVKSGLILDKVATDSKIEVSEEDLNEKIEQTAKSSGLDSAQIKEYYTSNENIKRNLMYAIREEKTFAKLQESVKVK